MKKYLMTLSVLAITLVMATGCGGKKLVCTAEEGTAKSEVTTSFKNGKATEATMKVTMEANSEEEAAQGKALLEGLASTNTEDYITVKVDQKGKTVTMTSTLHISKMTDEQIAEELDGSDLTEESIKKYYEDDGYTCK